MVPNRKQECVALVHKIRTKKFIWNSEYHAHLIAVNEAPKSLISRCKTTNEKVMRIHLSWLHSEHKRNLVNLR